MAPVLKTGRAQALVGSNPTPSANLVSGFCLDLRSYEGKARERGFKCASANTARDEIFHVPSREAELALEGLVAIEPAFAEFIGPWAAGAIVIVALRQERGELFGAGRVDGRDAVFSNDECGIAVVAFGKDAFPAKNREFECALEFVAVGHGHA
jgi:hypothetical protein